MILLSASAHLLSESSGLDYCHLNKQWVCSIAISKVASLKLITNLISFPPATEGTIYSLFLSCHTNSLFEQSQLCLCIAPCYFPLQISPSSSSLSRAKQRQVMCNNCLRY